MGFDINQKHQKFKCSLLSVFLFFCPGRITPNSGLTGPNNTYIYIYIYIGYVMKPSKTVDFKVDWSMWTQWTPALTDEEVALGPTHSSR